MNTCREENQKSIQNIKKFTTDAVADESISNFLELPKVSKNSLEL